MCLSSNLEKYKKLSKREVANLRYACERFNFDFESALSDHNRNPRPHSTARVVLGFWYRMH